MDVSTVLYTAPCLPIHNYVLHQSFVTKVDALRVMQWWVSCIRMICTALYYVPHGTEHHRPTVWYVWWTESNNHRLQTITLYCFVRLTFWSNIFLCAWVMRDFSLSVAACHVTCFTCTWLYKCVWYSDRSTFISTVMCIVHTYIHSWFAFRSSKSQQLVTEHTSKFIFWWMDGAR